jgi:uncharacterized protein (DUF1919 family)
MGLKDLFFWLMKQLKPSVIKEPITVIAQECCTRVVMSLAELDLEAGQESQLILKDQEDD